MPLHVEVVAAERSILSGEADEVLADTAKGQVGILPRHAAMLTLLVPGTVRLRRGSEEEILAVGGGTRAERMPDHDLVRQPSASS